MPATGAVVVGVGKLLLINNACHRGKTSVQKDMRDAFITSASEKSDRGI